MAARAYRFYVQSMVRKSRKRERIFRDRTIALDIYNDSELFDRFRFRREDILYLTDILSDSIDHPQHRKGSLPAFMQVMVALRFYASNCFKIVAADLFGLGKATVSRIIHRVSRALASHLDQFV